MKCIISLFLCWVRFIPCIWIVFDLGQALFPGRIHTGMMTLPNHVVFLTFGTHRPVILMETSQLKWIDTHCHLYVHEFDTDRDEMIRRALSGGIGKLMLPNIDEATVPDMWKLVNQFPTQCF